MSPVIFFILFVTSFQLLRLLWYILKFYKKIASIPTAPGRSWLFGHLKEVYRIKKVEQLSWITAPYFFIYRVAASNRTTFIANGKDIGVYKIYFGPFPVVVVSSPEAAEIVFKTTGIHKPSAYEIGHIFAKGLPNINGEEYKYHKKIMASYFKNIDVMDRVNKHFHRFTESIGEGGIIRDLFTTTNLVTDSIASETITRHLLFYDQQNQRLDDVKATANFLFSTMGKPWQLLHTSFWRSSEEGTKFFECFKRGDIFLKFTEEAIKDFDSVDAIVENDQPTLMNLLIQEHLKNPHTLTKHDVAGELKLVWGASYDTVAISLTYLLHEVGHRPDIQDKIFNELNNVLNPSQELTIDIIEKLPYLEAVVKESLRRHPPGPLLGKQAVEDIKIPRINDEGFMTIPKRTMILIDTHAVNHNPRHWKEPEELKPNRFLSDKHFASDNPYSYVTFSAGRRVCPGKKIAYLTLQIILAKLMQRYHIESLNPLGSIKEEYKPFLHPTEEILVKFTNRS